MVTWAYVVAHTPGGPKIPSTLPMSSGGTVSIHDGGAVVAPSCLPDTLVTDEGMLSRHMGEAWCARAPYPVEVITDLTPNKEDSPWVVPFWTYDNITIEAAARKGLAVCARPAWKYVADYYPEIFNNGHAPCAVPAEVRGPGGSVPLIPTFPLYDADGSKVDLVNEVKAAVDKAAAAGYGPVFCLYLNVYTESDLTTAGDIIGELSDMYGPPAGLDSVERVVRAAANRIQLDAISSLHWEALRLHDVFYDYNNTDLDTTARAHGLAVSLRAMASLSIAAKTRAPVPRAEHYSYVYGTDIPVPAMLHDEQSITSYVRMKVHLADTNADTYHNLVRDFETAVRATVSPFPE